jgi:SAM-dependent methyltransferase
VDASAFFRRSWSLYDAIVESNHMHHREIYETVSGVIGERAAKGSFRMMDLGCGNARCVAPILRRHRPDSYQGVDLSEAALAEASSFLHGIEGISWTCADLLEHAESERSDWDIIFSGFAVHHLQAEEKQRLFHAIARIVRGNGFFLMVDVVREEGMSREDHVRAYTGMMRSEWNDIPAEALEEGCAHVMAYDYPATAEELADAAWGAGFSKALELGLHGPHRTFLFSKQGMLP